MELLYWIGEFIKVFAGYMTIMYVWPNIVFRKYLSGRSVTFRFSFCVTTQIVLVNGVVIMLGLFHLLNIWAVRGLFWGELLFSILKDVRITDKHKRLFRYVITGTFGIKNLFYRIRLGIKNGRKSLVKWFFGKIKGHVWEYSLITLLVIYGMIYFDYGAFQDYSFGTGDLYPHAAWVYGLTLGKPFSAGIYPEGMHCFVYAIHSLFGVKLYSVMLFLGSVHIHVFLLGVYIFLRTVYKWRYTSLLALTAFLTVDASCNNMVYCYARLQWTIPQEFALFTPFMCAAFLVRYLQFKPDKAAKKKAESRAGLQLGKRKRTKAEKFRQFLAKRPLKWFYGDENLYLFSMSLAAAITIHFYPAIMAFFFCACLALFMFHRIFIKGRFWPLVGGAMFGLMLAVVPMAGAFASGIPFQGSIGWALSVIGIEEKKDESAESPENVGSSDQAEDSSASADGKTQGNLPPGTVEPGELQPGTVVDTVPGSEPETSGGIAEKLKRVPQAIGARIENLKNTLPALWDKLYRRTYWEVFRDQRAHIILAAAGIGICMWAAYKMLSSLLWLIPFCRKRIKVSCFDTYPGLILLSQLFIVMYSPGTFGMPMLIDASRLCAVQQMLNLAMIALPLDMVFAALQIFMPRALLKLAGLAGMVGVVAFTQVTDSFHGYLYYMVTRYNSAVMVTNSITEKLPQWDYTIVSTTDELYQQIQYGWHEEQVHFINQASKEGYTLPSEYIFIYLEKKTLKRNQSHVFTGPRWIAWNKYTKFFGSEEIISYDNDGVYCLRPGSFLAEHSRIYANVDSRQLIQVTTQDWLEIFDKIYPNELKVYYEDDDFVCYYFKQNVNRLYDLGIRIEADDEKVYWGDNFNSGGNSAGSSGK